MGCNCLMSMELLGDEENVLELDTGGGHTTS